MGNYKLSRNEILNLVEEKKVTPEEGVSLIQDSKQDDKYDFLYFNPVWTEKNLEPVEQLPGSVLVFDNTENEDLRFQLSSSGKMDGTDIRYATAHDDYGNNEDSSKFGYRPGNEDDITKIIQKLAETGKLPGAVIINCENISFPGTDIEKQLEESIYTALYCSQALMKQKVKEKVRIFVVYKGRKDAPNPFIGALSGFAKTLSLENSRYSLTTIGFEDGSAASNAAILIDELTACQQSSEIFYSGGKRYAAGYQETDKGNRTEVPPIRDGGVYLITGGLGGLGLIFARGMASIAKVKLVLTGRSDLSPDKEKIIEEIEKKGSEVEYIKGDISKESDVKNIIQKLKKKFGSLQGVFHSAGVNRDSYIIKKKKEEIDTVLGAKVFGTLYLDKTLKDEKLDFFMMCSSIAATLGNSAQCDYAYANRFMDYYSGYRNSLVAEKTRSGKSIAINWPLWRRGGMHVDEEKEKMFIKMWGMVPMTTGAGEKALIDAINSEFDSIVVAQGIGSKLREIIAGKDEIFPQEAAPGGISSAGDITTALENDIVKKISSIVGVDTADIDNEAEFDELGFDSVKLTRFVNEINDLLDLDLTPAVMFEYTTIEEFINFLKSDYIDALTTKYGGAAQAVPAQELVQTAAGGGINDAALFDDLKKMISLMLGIGVDDIDNEAEFDELGFDSVKLTSFVNEINDLFTLDLTPAIMFEYTTLEDFCSFLQSDHKEALASKYGGTVKAVPVQAASAAPAAGGVNEAALFGDLKKIISRMLGISVDDIDNEAEFDELGFDSVKLTGFVNEINDLFALDLTPAVMFEYTTLEEFSEYLLTEFQTALVSKYGGAVKTAPVQTAVPAAKSGSINKAALGDDLKKIISRMLGIDVDDIDNEAEFDELGFDSVKLTAFVNEINDLFTLDLTPAVMFEYTTLEEFSEYLLADFADKLVLKYGGGNVPQAAETARVKTEAVSIKQQDKTAISRKQVVYKEDIAIIGMSGVFPGAPDLETFWQNLADKKDMITEIPPGRWDWQDYAADDVSKWGGFMDDIDKFDPRFFNISPREAEVMDPQQRVYLETIWKTIEDSGYKPSQLSGTKTGLYVGLSVNDYAELMVSQGASVEAQTSIGTVHSMMVNRISYLLNFRGPSEPVDTACSSSLVAIHRALQDLRDGTCEMAIAGGVNELLSPKLYISFSKAGMMSPDGRCKTFDKSANGYVRGEGAGAVFLKPLGKAVEDRDYIYGVIKGSSINHGGRAKSLTAPNPNAQAELLVEAYRKAGVDPATVTYIEAHGTGTSLGDPIEINGLKKAFSELYMEHGKTFTGQPHCGLGSVKTSIGHLESSAGIAGLIKILLSMKHKKLAGTVHFTEQNPYIQLEKSPFYIIKDTREWKQVTDEQGNSAPRRAGVSSFGFGGVNAHVVVEEYVENLSPSQDRAGEKMIFILSAKNRGRIEEYARNLAGFIENNNQVSLSDIAYTLSHCREDMEERLAIVTDNRNDLIKKLREYSSGNSEAGNVKYGNISARKRESDKLLDEIVKKKGIGEYIEEKEYTMIAGLWTQGVPIEWELLALSGHKIPLTTYPFEKKRYWFEPGEEAEVKKYSAGPSVSTVAARPEEKAEVTVQKGNESQKISNANFISLFSKILKIPEDKIDIDVPIVDLGIDSIVMLQLVKEINKEYNLKIGANDIIEIETIRGIIGFLEENVPFEIPGESEKKKTKASAKKETVVKTKESSAVKNRQQRKSSLSDLKDILAGITKMDKSQLQLDVSLEQYGIDSIVMLQLIKQINSGFGINITAGDLVELNTITSIAEYIDDKTGGAPVSEEKPVKKEKTKTAYVPEKPVVAKKKKKTVKQEMQEPVGESHILSEVKEIIAKITRLDESELSVKENFENFGIDSIVMLQLIKQLNTKFNVSLTAGDLIEAHTIESLVTFISKKIE